MPRVPIELCLRLSFRYELATCICILSLLCLVIVPPHAGQEALSMAHSPQSQPLQRLGHPPCTAILLGIGRCPPLLRGVHNREREGAEEKEQKRESRTESRESRRDSIARCAAVVRFAPPPSHFQSHTYAGRSPQRSARLGPRPGSTQRRRVR